MPADAVAIAAPTTAFQNALDDASSPYTRTPVTIGIKDDAKIALLALLRPYAVQISLNAGVLSSDKIAVGVNPRTSTPTPIATPTTNPVIAIIAAYPLQHVLRFRDETSSPTVKAKPYGVTQIQVFASASTTPITDPALLAFKTVDTKSPTLISWLAGDAGKTAYYAARWQTRAGLVGPFSPIVSFTVANG